MARRTASRPSAAPARSASTAAYARPTATRPTTTQPATTQQQPQPMIVQQPQQGIMSQIATTAAGVAVGHTVGRMVTSLFSGSSPASPAEGATMAQQERCAPDVQQFVECMNKHHDDMAACQHFYDVMRQCSQAQ